MTPQELKNSILQLAIQGKLVEQRPEEGTAEELFARIQEEKQRLIAEKKIKKEKPLPEITEDEKPFDIPESWKFIRIADICQLLDGEKIKIKGANYPYLEAKYLRGKTEPKILNEGKLVKQGTKVILVDGENSGEVFDVLEDGYMGSTFKILFISSNVCTRYILFFLELHRNTLKNNKRGAAIPHLDKQIFFNLFVPLPPLAEQKRIVDKIQELLPYIDRYEQAWSKLEQFNSRFPEDMKKSLLQYAIQGKLVEQRPEEGTAEELFTQIQEEKQRLIAEKKIKKEKPLPEITEDEKPFDIPESWKWVRLLDVCKTVADGDHQAPPQVPSGIPFLVISNISKGNLDFSNTRYVTQEYFDSLAYDRIAESNDILFSVTGSYGIPVIVDCEQKFCFQRHIALIKGMININYLWLLLGSPVVKAQCDKVATGTAQKTVGLKSLKSIVVPLPPLVEQKRIVEKLEQLLPLCERLK